MSICWKQQPEDRPTFKEIIDMLDNLLGEKPEDYLNCCGDPEATFLPNLNSDDNREADSMFWEADSMFR